MSWAGALCPMHLQETVPGITTLLFQTSHRIAATADCPGNAPTHSSAERVGGRQYLRRVDNARFPNGDGKRDARLSNHPELLHSRQRVVDPHCMMAYFIFRSGDGTLHGVTLVPSCVGKDVPNQNLTSYLVNESVAIDAGSIGLLPDMEAQARIRHVFLSHSHMDHIASLPAFLENVYKGTSDCVRIHCTREVEEVLRQDIFNDRVWPDFVGLSQIIPPFLKFERLESGRSVFVEGLSVTPVSVNHTVDTVAFVIEDATSAVAIVTDTGPTEAIWEKVNETRNMSAIFLDVAFPNEMQELACVAKHLTPAMFRDEIAKVKLKPKIFVVHMKPSFSDELVAELMALGVPEVEICTPNVTYEFP
ncbi:MAG: 3',5'-cyclic-nucleotide phosphodiesterase [Planctomycetota bacterium]